MRHPATHLSGPSTDRAFSAKQRLSSENARRGRRCAERRDVEARYELLLREGDHRIKNSLQVVASFLSLQERRETNDAVKTALHAAVSRIHAVARIHDMLQLNGGEDAIDLGASVAGMCEALHAMAGHPGAIKIVVTADPLQTSLELAQPILLAVNELVINALRHAFPNGHGGAVLVTIKQARGQLNIVVADDGVGLPNPFLENGGYGMTLVRAMVEKMGGLLQPQSLAGARFTLTIPLSSLTVTT